MAWTKPTVADFKAKFVRDFNYAPADAPNDTAFITDADIQSALDDAEVPFTPQYGTDTQNTNVFLYLAAHNLVTNLGLAGKGLSSQAKFPITATSVGGVSLSFTIPEKYLKDPTLAAYATTGYGMKYIELALPFTKGAIGHVAGTTTWG